MYISVHFGLQVTMLKSSCQESMSTGDTFFL